jgi:secreted PhoX family phosphatase
MGDEPESNPSSNPWLADIIAQRYSRRQMVASGVAVAVSTAFARHAVADGAGSSRSLGHRAPLSPGFEPVPHSTADAVVVPEGYSVQVLIPEGEPLLRHAPPYIPGDYNSGADREQQIGAHHDGMWFFPFQHGESENRRGLLCVNHENINPELIHPGTNPPGGTYEAGNFRPVEDEVRKEIASHGVSVVEIRREGTRREGEWKVVRGLYNRRITAGTEMLFTGPVRGTDFLKTRYSPHGTRTRGTLNNCANGYTPWGTYLTCEENWAFYFYNTGLRPREQLRYGVPSAPTGTLGWGTRPEDEYNRFNATPIQGADPTQDYRNEPNGFGWVVEIDPLDPHSTPKKHTALGRFAHEGAEVAPVSPGRPVVVYMGDDSRGEYMYKFVSSDVYRPGRTDGSIFHRGTLYVARFNEDGTGVWIALRHGANGLTEANGFRNQADVLVNARSAADYVGATRMDRPEWTAVNPFSRRVYLACTNNSNRGAAATQPVDAANPRARNPDGHIVCWQEAGGRFEATGFSWFILFFGGPTREQVLALGTSDPVYQGDERYAVQAFPGTSDQRFLGDQATFNSPDGMWVSRSGIMWIQTDGYANELRGFGHQQMLAANPSTGELRRFLTGPIGCEITGITETPDQRTLFVNIQHPEGASMWPNIDGETRARSATIVITKDDGGIIGT